MSKLLAKPYQLPKATNAFPTSKHDKAMEALLAKSDALAEGDLVGYIMRFPVADSYAYYMVVKEHPLTLQWIPYSDAWQVQRYTIAGLTLKDVKFDQARRSRMRLYFRTTKNTKA